MLDNWYCSSAAQETIYSPSKKRHHKTFWQARSSPLYTNIVRDSDAGFLRQSFMYVNDTRIRWRTFQYCQSTTQGTQMSICTANQLRKRLKCLFAGDSNSFLPQYSFQEEKYEYTLEQCPDNPPITRSHSDISWLLFLSCACHLRAAVLSSLVSHAIDVQLQKCSASEKRGLPYMTSTDFFYPLLPLSLSQISWFCSFCLIFGDPPPIHPLRTSYMEAPLVKWQMMWSKGCTQLYSVLRGREREIFYIRSYS